MSELPESLLPRTYWEARCALLEESVLQLMHLLRPLVGVQALNAHMDEWNRLMGVITQDYAKKAGTPQ